MRDKHVAVNGGQMARQCLEAGLLDDVSVELVPVVLDGGTPLFAELVATPVQFEDLSRWWRPPASAPPALPGQEVGLRLPGAAAAGSPGDQASVTASV